MTDRDETGPLRAFHASGCLEVPGEHPAAARRRGTAAECAGELADALRLGDLPGAATLLRELNCNLSWLPSP